MEHPSATAVPRPAPKVAIVLLNWNDGAATAACLEALRSQHYPNYAAIVVDNGSTERFAPADPATITIRSTSNLGYAGGMNLGIGRALADGADYVWLLNTDAIIRPDVLCRLVAAAAAGDRTGLVSPVFHDPDQPQVAEFCLARFDPVARVATQTAESLTARAWQRDYPDQIVVLGTALLISRRLIETIGTLDARFFAYVEDVDYSLRAHAAGFQTVVVPDAVVLHKFKQPLENPGSVPQYLHYFITRNYLLLWRKLPGPVLWRKATLWFLHQRLTQIVRMRNVPTAIDAVLAGLWDGLRGKGGPYRPDHLAPWLLRTLLGRHAEVWLAMMDRRQRKPD